MTLPIRQVPGWWATLVHAVCDECGWVGPTRDTSDLRGATLARLDASGHRCYEED